MSVDLGQKMEIRMKGRMIVGVRVKVKVRVKKLRERDG